LANIDIQNIVSILSTDIQGFGGWSLKRINPIFPSRDFISSGLDYEEGFPIFLKNLSGKSFLIRVRSMDLVLYMKNKVKEKLGIPANIWNMSYEGKLLQDVNHLK